MCSLHDFIRVIALGVKCANAWGKGGNFAHSTIVEKILERESKFIRGHPARSPWQFHHSLLMNSLNMLLMDSTFSTILESWIEAQHESCSIPIPHRSTSIHQHYTCVGKKCLFQLRVWILQTLERVSEWVESLGTWSCRVSKLSVHQTSRIIVRFTQTLRKLRKKT